MNLYLKERGKISTAGRYSYGKSILGYKFHTNEINAEADLIFVLSNRYNV